MRHLILAVLLAVASTASAGTVTVNGQTGSTSGAADAAQAALRTQHNRLVCGALGPSCTQAQRDSACEAGPGQCGKVYASNATGAALYFLDRVLAIAESAVPEQAAIDKAAAERAWDQATPAQRSAACQAMGRDASCQ